MVRDSTSDGESGERTDKGSGDCFAVDARQALALEAWGPSPVIKNQNELFSKALAPVQDSTQEAPEDFEIKREQEVFDTDAIGTKALIGDELAQATKEMLDVVGYDNLEIRTQIKRAYTEVVREWAKKAGEVVLNLLGAATKGLRNVLVASENNLLAMEPANNSSQVFVFNATEKQQQQSDFPNSAFQLASYDQSENIAQVHREFAEETFAETIRRLHPDHPKEMKDNHKSVRTQWFQDQFNDLVYKLQGSGLLSDMKMVGHQEFSEAVMNTDQKLNKAFIAAMAAGYTNLSYRSEQFGYWAVKLEDRISPKVNGIELFPRNFEINDDHIRQDFPDSCNFISALIGLAQKPDGPEKIQKMITKNVGGNYLVKFPGAKDAIEVSKLTEGEKYYGSTDDRGFLYVAVLEKAYGLYLNGLQKNPTVIPADGAIFGTDDQNGSIAMRLMTGHEPFTLKMSPTGMGCGKEKLASELATAFAEESVISVGMKASPYHDRRGLRPNHSYALFLQNGKMLLRDSLKTGDTSMIETTVDDLYANFNIVRIEKRL